MQKRTCLMLWRLARTLDQHLMARAVARRRVPVALSALALLARTRLSLAVIGNTEAAFGHALQLDLDSICREVDECSVHALDARIKDALKLRAGEIWQARSELQAWHDRIAAAPLPVRIPARV